MERILLVAVCVAAIAGFGCSISNSSDTLSDSSSSPFKWSSSSSDSSSDAATAYRQDVSDYTLAFASNRADGDTPSVDELHAFRSGMRQLAEQRGVTDWEADPLTCASIGFGLRAAQIGDARAMEFARLLLGEDAVGLESLRSGYARVQ
jgi:hypothetical protein